MEREKDSLNKQLSVMFKPSFKGDVKNLVSTKMSKRE